MAVTHIILVAIVVMTLPFAENAPSNNVRNTKEDELQRRLVFVDKNNDNSINGNSRVISEITPPILTEKRGLSHSNDAGRPVFAPNNPPLVVSNAQTIKSTGITRMDDERQNWGLLVDNTYLTEDESYFNRPLAIPRTVDRKILEDPKPNTFTRKPTESPKVVYKPGACDTAIIACCAGTSELMDCFMSKGCSNVTKGMFTNLCSADNIKLTIKTIADYYKG